MFLASFSVHCFFLFSVSTVMISFTSWPRLQPIRVYTKAWKPVTVSWTTGSSDTATTVCSDNTTRASPQSFLSFKAGNFVIPASNEWKITTVNFTGQCLLQSTYTRRNRVALYKTPGLLQPLFNEKNNFTGQGLLQSTYTKGKGVALYKTPDLLQPPFNEKTISQDKGYSLNLISSIFTELMIYGEINNVISFIHINHSPAKFEALAIGRKG